VKHRDGHFSLAKKEELDLPDHAYKELFTALSQRTIGNTPLAMPLSDGIEILKAIEKLRTPITSTEVLPLYQGGMAAHDGREEILAPEAKNLMKELKPLYRNPKPYY
jgi:hypothetical protein